MKIHLDRERCQGHGRCYVLAPGVFESDDDGYGLAVGTGIVPEASTESARKGAANCPEDAITIIEE